MWLTLPPSFPRGEQAYSCSGNHQFEVVRPGRNPGSAADR